MATGRKSLFWIPRRDGEGQVDMEKVRKGDKLGGRGDEEDNVVKMWGEGKEIEETCNQRRASRHEREPKRRSRDSANNAT